MARQSRRLRDPGPRRRAHSMDFRLLFECRRPAAVRDRTAVGRARLPHHVAGELLITAGPGEWRAAWLEDGSAGELYIERGDTKPIGSIHLGRIIRRSPGLNAVFADIGEERPGFLPMPDPPVDEGARVLVQVRRETQRGKGALLSTRITPPGRVGQAQLRALAARLDP